jgi:Transposase DDE domain
MSSDSSGRNGDMATTQRHLPFGPQKLLPFTTEIFDREEEKAARILHSILETQSPRKSDWSQVFSASSEASNYRTIDRVLPKLEPKKALMRLYDPESPFVLVDPTEIERKQAKNTDYVGRLSDGKTLGFWTIIFAQPYRGRAIPFHFGIYSEATLNEEITSRNLEWRELFWQIKELVGETPLVFDREFSAQRWLETLEEARCKWVVRLNTKNGVKVTDEQGEEIPLLIEKGEQREIKGAYYRGEVKVNVGGIWLKDQKEPLWVMGNLEPDELLEVYKKRMKIEQTFKDSKSLLHIEKVMSKQRGHLERTLALVLLAYGLGLMIGETARDEAYGGDEDSEGDEKRGFPKRSVESGSSIRDCSCC